ncbi:hypothetical protein ABTX81_08600 [Kitasatospora sp. NPDC097605]|uniref:hypothetical protein n=1 Tax=Kitasatospora sp. NPDC097605 TaxID=3157226 RepID=UPI00332F34AD
MADFDRSDVADGDVGGGGRGFRRGRWTPVPLAAAAAVVAVAVTGCAGGGSTASSATGAAGAAPPLSQGATEAAREVGWPLEAALRGDAESRAVLANALNKISAKCAREQGYQVTERPPVTAEQLIAEQKTQGGVANPYAWPSAQALKDFGYAGSAHGRDAKPPETEQPVAADPAAGTAASKCAKETAARLTAADPAGSSAQRRLRELTEEADRRTTADARMVAALAQWSACMKPSGYSYASPLEAEQQFEKVVGAAGSQELAVARADADCRTAGRLADVWVQVRSQAEQQLVEQNAQVLKEAADADRRMAQEATRAAAG